MGRVKIPSFIGSRGVVRYGMVDIYESMANGSKQDLRGSCPFIEEFAIHHRYPAFQMMVIHRFFW